MAELDEGRPKVVEQHPKSSRHRLAPALWERLDGFLAAHLPPKPGPFEQVGETMTRCDDADLAKPVQILERLPNQGAPELRTAPGAGQTVCLADTRSGCARAPAQWVLQRMRASGKGLGVCSPLARDVSPEAYL